MIARLIFIAILLLGSACGTSNSHRVKMLAQYDLFCYPRDIEVKHFEDTGLYQAECNYDHVKKVSTYTIQDDEIRLVSRGH